MFPQNAWQLRRMFGPTKKKKALPQQHKQSTMADHDTKRLPAPAEMKAGKRAKKEKKHPKVLVAIPPQSVVAQAGTLFLLSSSMLTPPLAAPAPLVVTETQQKEEKLAKLEAPRETKKMHEPPRPTHEKNVRPLHSQKMPIHQPSKAN
jgi:hypothetical protein